jgi:hypothetical protein
MPATQIFEHRLNLVAGYYGRGMLQIAVRYKSTEKDKAIAGRCGYLDANGEWNPGPPPAKKGPPLFIWRGTNQPDVLNDGVAADGTIYWKNPNLFGVITCFVGTGGFEFSTTEYDTAASYSNGDALTVAADGRLTKTTAEPFGTTAIVGFCSPFRQQPENFLPATSALAPSGVDSNLRPVLNFHTCFYAARSA